jgi:autotransporter-associated beta strand protein
MLLAAWVAAVVACMGGHVAFAQTNWNGSVSGDFFDASNWSSGVPSAGTVTNIGSSSFASAPVFASSSGTTGDFSVVNTNNGAFTVSSGTLGMTGPGNLAVGTTSGGTATFTMNGGVVNTNRLRTSIATGALATFSMSGGQINATSSGDNIGWASTAGSGDKPNTVTTIVMTGGTIQGARSIDFGVSNGGVTTQENSRVSMTMSGGLMATTGLDGVGTLRFQGGSIALSGGIIRGGDVSARDGFKTTANNGTGGLNYLGGVVQVNTNLTEGTLYIIPATYVYDGTNDPTGSQAVTLNRGFNRLMITGLGYGLSRSYTSLPDSAVRCWMTTNSGTQQANAAANNVGDYNLDGVVNQADASYWSSQNGLIYTTNYTSPANMVTNAVRYYGADGNGDGIVDQADFDVWNTHYRQSTTSGIYAWATPVTIAVSSGQQTQTTAGYSNLSFTTASSVTKTGGGTLVLNQANSMTGTITIQGGSVQLSGTVNAAAAATIRPEAGGTLTLDPYLQTSIDGLKPLAGGLTDVGTGMVTVAAGGLSVADMVTAITAGRNGGSWDGTTGITSSEAAAGGGTRAVGWLENVVNDAQGNANANLSSVTFAFAAPGDTNLDWQVDVTDAANLVAFGKYDTAQPATWLEGDFNYDGIVDVTDAADFINTGLYNTGFYNPPVAQGAVAAVPEPSSLGVAVGMTGLVLAWRLRRRTA